MYSTNMLLIFAENPIWLSHSQMFDQLPGKLVLALLARLENENLEGGDSLKRGSDWSIFFEKSQLVS